VLSDKPACWRSAETSSKALGAVTGLELYAERAQNIDTPAGSRLAVLFILAHGSGYFAVDEPVSTSDIVIVSAAARALCDKGPHMFDGRKGARCAGLCGRRHYQVREGSVTGRKQKTPGMGGVDKCTLAGQTCHLNGGTKAPGFASDQEGPSVHLAAICNDWRRGIDSWASKWSAKA
jgi:hypothetical protein